MRETLPPGALLRDARSPDLLDIRSVSADDNSIVVSIDGQARRYNRKAARLRQWLLPARTAVVIIPSAENETQRVGTILLRIT